MLVAIDDGDDPRLALYAGLKDADLRLQVEAAHGVFVVEGKVPIRRLLASSYPLHSVLVLASRLADLPELEHLDVPVYVAPRNVLAATVGFDVHRGALAVAHRLPLPDPAALLAAHAAVVVLESVNDHENLGAIARTSRALGAGALLLDPTCSDPLYRRAVRVSMGELLHLPFTRLQPWPDALDAVRAAGHLIVALTPRADAEPIDALAADRPARVALLLGAEGPGLSAGALQAADRRVRIPIHPDVDSLNVGHAAAIALHRLVAPR